MKLNSITLKNFKAIGAEPQTINLAPITLLFGPNSAGKSTVLQSLLFLREVLANGNLNPDKTEVSGDAVDLGGFINLLHNKNTLSEMEIGVNISEFGSLTDCDFDHDREQYGSELDPFDQLDFVEDIDITLTFVQTSKGTVSKCLGIKFNGEEVGKISASGDGKQVFVEELNLSHKIFWKDLPRLTDQDEENEFSKLFNLFSLVADPDRYDSADRHENPTNGKTLNIVNQEGAIPNLNRLFSIDAESWTPPLPKPELNDKEKQLGLDLKKVKEILSERIRESEELSNNRILVTDILNAIFYHPLKILSDGLNDFTYIGPLRDLPPKSEQGQLSPEKGRWAKGIAAWEILGQVDENFLEDLNGWLDKEHFDTGYELSIKKYKEVEIGSYIDRFVNDGVGDPELEQIREYVKSELDALPTKVNRRLLETSSNIEVTPQDIGVGISQLVPILVAASYKTGLIAIEQPELHLHPRVQVELGDFFIEKANKGNTLFLIETHSEHLLLRLLRRIREHYSEDGDEEIEFPLRLDQISVVYVERKESGAHYSNQTIVERGDFTADWPDGFFEERDDELYI